MTQMVALLAGALAAADPQSCTVGAYVRALGSTDYCAGTSLTLQGGRAEPNCCLVASTFQWYDGATAIPGATSTVFIVPGSLPPGSHDYVLEAICSNPPSVTWRSAPLPVNIRPAPVAVGNLRLERRDANIRFEWDADPNASGGYHVYWTAAKKDAGSVRNTTLSGNWVLLTGGWDVAAVDPANNAPLIFYQVLAACIDGTEGPS